MIPHLRDLFGTEVGLSDHTHGIGAGIAAVALGAAVIEKHITFSRAEGGVDSAYSIEPAEMAALVTETERARQALGGLQYGPTKAEQGSMHFRRSVYCSGRQSRRAADAREPAHHPAGRWPGPEIRGTAARPPRYQSGQGWHSDDLRFVAERYRSAQQHRHKGLKSIVIDLQVALISARPRRRLALQP